MKSTGNRKRSVMLMGKRTSVCLEESFWLSLHAIVQMERITIEAFIESVKNEHDPRNLSSSLRVAILDYFQRLAARNGGVQDDAMHFMSGPRAEWPAQNRRETRDKVVAFWANLSRAQTVLAK